MKKPRKHVLILPAKQIVEEMVTMAAEAAHGLVDLMGLNEQDVARFLQNPRRAIASDGLATLDASNEDASNVLAATERVAT